MDAVTVEALHFSYEGGAELLRGISFSIEAGETVVIAGASGCGKTTLCRVLCGIIPNAVGGELSGEIRLFGESCIGTELSQMATRVGYLFQQSDDQIICSTVEDELAFGPENLCLPPDEIARRVDEMLHYFGLRELRLMNPERLSGGQKKLVALAAVLILEPEVIILDEPMAGLDTRSRVLVKDAIERLGDEGKTVVVVEHDLSLADYADRWLLLDKGSVAAEGKPLEFAGQAALLKRLGMLYD